MPKYFTVEQANTALETIRPLIAELMQLREEIMASQPEVWPVIQSAVGNGGSKLSGEIAFKFRKVESIVERVQAMGVLIKDLDTGLLDFPAWRDGRLVYLCWRYGEGSVAYWHDIDAGFAGREPI